MFGSAYVGNFDMVIFQDSRSRFGSSCFLVRPHAIQAEAGAA